VKLPLEYKDGPTVGDDFCVEMLLEGHLLTT
jgi:hypothetical protein